GGHGARSRRHARARHVRRHAAAPTPCPRHGRCLREPVGGTPGSAASAGPRRMTPLGRLRARVERLGSPLCLGLDPHPDRLPEGVPANIGGVESFARGVLEAVAAEVSAVKINVAFFEAFGSAGWAALERLRADVPGDLYVI